MTQYCTELFRNIYIEKYNQEQVKLGYCCQSQTTEPTDQVDFNHEFLENGRQYFLQTNKLPSACKICTDLESNGADSFRTRLLKSSSYPQQYKADLQSIHYNCDPICNLKCIVCSGLYSSSWIADEIALGISKNKIKPTKHNNLFWNLNLKNVQSIYFNGGEPLLTNDHINVMEKISNNRAKRISLCYSTNATIFPSKKVLEQWSRFHNVGLQLSIDATGPALEYIRFPSSWDQIVTNIRDMQNIGLKNLSFSFVPNIGLHNIFYLEDLLAWGNKMQIQMMLVPTGHTFSILNLPLHLKANAIAILEDCAAKYKNYVDLELYVNLVNSISNPDLNWISWMNRLDKIRNTNWKTSLSKLYKLDPSFFDSY